MFDCPPRLPRGAACPRPVRRIRLTGHPSPAAQLVDQRRCGSGMTHAHNGVMRRVGGSAPARPVAPLLPPLPAPPEAEEHPRAAFWTKTVRTAALPDLLLLLRRLGAAGKKLPGPGHLARELGDGWTAPLVLTALRDMAALGQIFMWTNRRRGPAWAAAVMVRAAGDELSGVEVRSAGAPAEIQCDWFGYRDTTEAAGDGV